MSSLRDLLVHADGLTGIRGGAWTLVEVVPLARGDVRLRLHHDEAGAVDSMAYAVLAPSRPTEDERGSLRVKHVSALPAPEEARARVAGVLARSSAVPRGGWVDLAGAVLDALVPPLPNGSLAAWCARSLRFDAVRVEAEGRVATLTFATPALTRSWARFGELLVHAELTVEERTTTGGADDPDRDAGMWCVGGGEVIRTEGALRLGMLGPQADRLKAPPDALALLARWQGIVRARLTRLLATPDAMIVPWLVAPDARLANLLEMRAACGPVPPLASPRAPDPDSVASAAAQLDRAGETAWSLGAWRIEVDLPAGELRLVRGAALARAIVRHPWDAGLYGGLDEDAAGAVLLARWLREVLLTAGQDATVSWHPFDPDFPEQRAPLTTTSVTQWLAMEPPDADIEPLLDWRVQGLVVGEEPWVRWEVPGAEPVTAEEHAAQVALRDRFVGRVADPGGGGPNLTTLS